MNTQTNQTIVITGIGMITPVGRNAFQTCASIRADISRITDIDYFDYENDHFDTLPLKGAFVYGVTDGHSGLGRTIRMVFPAINDMLSNSGLSKSELSKAGFYCGLPSSNRKGVNKQTETLLCTRIRQWASISFSSIQKMFPEGHASCAKALTDAVRDLQENRVNYAVAGGVDSLVESGTLAYLMKTERLMTEDNPDGYFPGEAAAYFLLETLENAEKRDARIFASIEAPSFAMEPETVFSDTPSTTTGLRQTITETFENLEDKGTNTGMIVCDLNGENYRFKEFGTVTPAVFSDIATSWKLIHPAELIGDTGAASFALSVCIASRALERGYAETDNILVCGASDDGLRGSVYLRKYSKPDNT